MQPSSEPQPHSPTPQQPRWIEAIAVLSLAILACWLMFVDLGASSFHDGDEALYATVAMEMTYSGDLLTPTYWGEPLFNKPPLMYWLMSASMSLLSGTIEWQSRFPSALMGLGLLVLVYWTARRLGGMWAALGASLLMLGNHQYLFEHSVRSANLDSGLVTLMFGAIAFGARAHKRHLDLVLSGIFTALVLMVKLPLAVFIVPTLFLHLWLQCRGAALRWLAWATLCVALIALPWHVYSLVQHGGEFWDVYFMYEIFGRTGDAVLDPDATWWTHLLAFWKSFLPWGPLLTVAGVCALIGWPKDSNERATTRLLAGYAFFILLFFCFIKSKWPWYGIPAYPAFAVLGALFVRDLLRSRFRRLAPLVVGLPILVRLLAVTVRPGYSPARRPARLWPDHRQLYSMELGNPEAWAWGLAALVAVLMILPLLRPLRKHLASTTLLLAGLGLALAIVTVASVPRLARTPASKLAEVLTENGVERILTLGFWPSPIYQDRQAPLTSVYFLSVPGAEVVDCVGDFACLSEELTNRTALVVHNSALKPKVKEALDQLLRTMRPKPEVWIMEPGIHGDLKRYEVR